MWAIQPGAADMRRSLPAANPFAYTQKVQALAPIAYWPLAESSGSVATDESGNARNGAYTSVALGAAGIGDGRSAATFDGSTSYCNVQGAGLTAAFSGAAGTLALWAKVSAAGVWTDGVTRLLAIFLVDASNFVRLRKISTANTLDAQYSAGGTIKTVQISTSTTGYFHLAATWNKAGDQFIVYFNGAQSGSTQTGLGTFAGSLATSLIGANSTAPANVHSGVEAHVALWASALSAAQIATLAVP